MQVKKRRKTCAATKGQAGKKVNQTVVKHGREIESWDIPETKLTSSVIKTYSKKQPFVTQWTSQTKKLNDNGKKNLHGFLSKPCWGYLISK